MDIVLALVAIGLGVVLAMCIARRAALVFVIYVEEGQIVRVTGKAPEPYLKDVENICTLWSIQRGRIKGFRGPKGIRIEVAGGIDARHRQAFANAWNYPL